ncbi:hypothetical protein FACS1894102_1690 [Spirochaetia bacterium]|nr:hypothetical protein FACS1894102_1690 [Spirochaetia bacterium]
MKKFLCYCVLLFIAGFVYSQSSNGAPDKAQVSQAAKILGVSEPDLQKWIDGKFTPVPSGVPEISAVQLYKEYEASAPKADRACKGKEIKVSGTVISVEEGYDYNLKKRYYISLQSGDSKYSHSVYIFFDDSNIEQVFDVSPDQKITILGTLIQKGMISIHIDHARIIK